MKHWIIAATQGDDDSIKALIDAGGVMAEGAVKAANVVETLPWE